MFNGVKNIKLEHVILFIIGVFLIYHFMKGRSCCGIEFFTPLDTIQTSLDENINVGCCISNTAGYSNDPISVSEAAPGFSTITPFNNPCN